jgi:hypothetical protein
MLATIADDADIILHPRGKVLHRLRPSVRSNVHEARLQELVMAVPSRVHPSRALGGTNTSDS